MQSTITLALVPAILKVVKCEAPHAPASAWRDQPLQCCSHDARQSLTESNVYYWIIGHAYCLVEVSKAVSWACAGVRRAPDWSGASGPAAGWPGQRKEGSVSKHGEHLLECSATPCRSAANNTQVPLFLLSASVNPFIPFPLGCLVINCGERGAPTLSALQGSSMVRCMRRRWLTASADACRLMPVLAASDTMATSFCPRMKAAAP